MSKQSLLWSTLAAAALAVAGCQTSLSPDSHASPAPPAPPAPAGPAVAAATPARGRGPTVPANMESAMGEMNRMLTALKTDAPDPAKAEQALKDLATFERDVAICKLLVPSQINSMTGTAKTEALASYRSMMTGLTKTLLDLEDAVNDKKPDEAKKLIAQLEEIEKQGHEELKVKPD